jgi:hypothetical protein
MADLPTARWYIAELTEEVIEGTPRNVVHRATRVIFADSPEDAYEKALTLSAATEDSYLNQPDAIARTRYWGLNEINLVGDDAVAAEPPKKHPRPHYRQSDRLTPAQVAMLMSFTPSELPN